MRAATSVVVLLILLSCASAIKLSDDVNPHQRVYDLFNGLLFKRGYEKGMQSGANGGVNCAVCTVGIALVEQLAEVHSTQVSQILDNICQWLPVDFQPTCTAIIDTYGPTIIKLLDQKYNADETCLSMGVCTNATCHLLIEKPRMSKIQNIKLPELAVKLQIKIAEDATEYPWEKVANHKPFYDFDNDDFSPAETLRGYDWRGKDCDDFDSAIHPGRKNTDLSAWVDHNCNGIYGKEPVSGKSYEELFCSDTPQYGVINLGDSATAHFHIPEEWINPLLINNQSFTNLLQILENELDWPHLSSGTAFVNSSSWIGAPIGPVDSSYMRYRDINRCMHRDYQNVGVNGARSSSMANTIMQTLARDQLNDFPVLLTYALIGNDVCNGHPGTDHMTTPDEMYDNVMKTLQYLDTVLPAGSHVSIMGLVDGRILYDSMGTRIYPAASVDQDITYATFYDFMDCLEISPCWGWTNSDEYWRNVTTERAFELNDVLQGIVENNTFVNFDMAYFDCPLDEVVKVWADQGGEAWQLIEPVDGFHPNQLANALTTQVIFEQAAQMYPWLIPPTNPHNAQIIEKFGDQGGHS